MNVNNDKVEDDKGERTKEKDRSNNNISISKDEISRNWSSFKRSQGMRRERSLKSDGAGIGGTGRKGPQEKSKFSNQPIVTKVLSLDCEMVSDLNDKDMLGRVSIVNFKLECVYDKFVKPTSPVGDYRTRFSGLRRDDVENGEDFKIVQREVKAMLRNRIVVGHALRNDFKVLKIWHPRPLIRDTSYYERFREVDEAKTPSLRSLAKAFLGENIQEGEHNSVEDAVAAMKLYVKYKQQWEASLLNAKVKN